MPKVPSFGALAIFLVAAALPAQRPPDVYTENGENAEAMAAAGIVSHGPFPFGDEHGTRSVEAALGTGKILWLETEHFRIGSLLTAYTIADTAEKKKLRAELKELKKIFPDVKTKTKVLDPWLRIHLYAQRLERIHDEVAETLGLPSMTAWPGWDEGHPVEVSAGREYPRGAELGESGQKLSVFLSQENSPLQRYCETFAGISPRTPVRYSFVKEDILFYGVSGEHGNGDFYYDSRMHTNVVFNVTCNLVNGYRGYRYQIPIYLVEGVAHHVRRKFDEDHNHFTAIELEGPALRDETNWEPYVRGWVDNGYERKAEELRSWLVYDKRTFRDHLNMWSRVEFLLDQDKEKFAMFFDYLTDQFEITEGPLSAEQVYQHHDFALKTVYGWDLEAYDEAYRAWVKKNYKRK